MLDDHLVRKKAFLDYKNICFTQLQYFSQTGKPMILVKKMEIPPALLLDKLGLEIMFGIHQGRKQALPDQPRSQGS